MSPLVVFAPVFLVLECERHIARVGERRVVVWDYLVRGVPEYYSLEGDDPRSPRSGGAGTFTRAHGEEEPHDRYFAGNGEMGVA